MSNKAIHRKVNAFICHVFNQTQTKITSSTGYLTESLQQANITINPCSMRSFSDLYSGLSEFKFFLTWIFPMEFL